MTARSWPELRKLIIRTNRDSFCSLPIPQSNNTRIFVVNSNVQKVAFL